MSQPAQSDAQDLATLGYKQELNRTLGSFSSFAAGFSYISILTGMFQTAALGFFFAGRAFIWAWPIVFLGQMTVALQFSELAAHYPLAGSVYQWSKRLAGKPWAWNTGWIYLCAQIVTIPAVALAWQVILPQISDKFQIVDCTAGPADELAQELRLPGSRVRQERVHPRRRDDPPHDDREPARGARSSRRSTTSA